jgi:hypothetical protein
MSSEPSRELAVPDEIIHRRIYLIRGLKVMVDSDLANLYNVDTKALNRAVKRNAERFPADFMFELTAEEASTLRRHFGASNRSADSGTRGGRRYLPHAFTEQGIAMLSSVLRSKRAVQMNIAIVRAFVKLREALAMHADLALALEEIRAKQDEHGQQIAVIFDTINELLLSEPVPPKRQIGFPTAPGK